MPSNTVTRTIQKFCQSSGRGGGASLSVSVEHEGMVDIEPKGDLVILFGEEGWVKGNKAAGGEGEYLG